MKYYVKISKDLFLYITYANGRDYVKCFSAEVNQDRLAVFTKKQMFCYATGKLNVKF